MDPLTSLKYGPKEPGLKGPENNKEEMKNPDTKKVEDFLNTNDFKDIKPEDKKKIIDRIDSLINKYGLKTAIKNTFEGYSDKMGAFNIKKDPVDINNREEIYNKFKEKFNLEKTEQVQKQIGNTGKSETKEQGKTNQETDKTQISFSKEATESKEFPILERLQKDGKVSQETLNSLFKDYKKGSTIDTSKIEDKEEKKIIDKYINDFKEREKPVNEQKDIGNNEDFEKDIERFEEFKDLNEAKDQKGSIEADIYSMMSKNYFKINPEITDDKETKANFEVSIKTSLNEIKNDYKTLNSDTETFKQAEQKINSGDLKKSLEGLQTIYLLASGTAAISNAKTQEQKDAIKAKLTPEMRKEISKIEEQIKTKEEQLKQEQYSKKKENLEQEIISLKKQEQEIISGEVFKPAKEDKTNETNNTKNPNLQSQPQK